MTMDYKEKYENALERARELKNKLEKNCSLATPTGIEYIFPELAESKDEMIRKELIRLLNVMTDGIVENYTTTPLRDFIAWLEKQAEPQPYRGNADTMRENLIAAFKSVGSNHWGGFDIRDIIHFLKSKDAIELEKQGEPNWVHHKVDLSDCSKEYRKAYYDGWNNCNKQHSQLKDEQKPAWSEDDEKIIETMCKEGDLRPSQMIWLKSLKNRVQPHWKPTEEQLQTLEETIEYDAADANVIVLRTLYNNLKKF